MEDRERETFGSLLRRLRAARGWTQEELAERAKVSAQAISTLERGTRRLPWPTTVARLADALNLTAEERDGFTAMARLDDAASRLSAQKPVLQFVAPTPPTNLPDDATRFIGRVADIKAVTDLLRDPSIRLVTLTGPGGIGKTRLAIEVGRSLLYDFRDGVYIASLASLTDPQLVPSAVAQAVEVKEHGTTDSVQMLIRHLREKHLLLILDNFEHLLEASDWVADLLDTCRNVHILITSRFLLHLSREHEYRVGPLALPARDSLPEIGEVATYESIALFLDRARAARPDFELTAENVDAVAGICARLDGLPLAIELGAARIRVFPPEALLGRLDDRLTVLTGGARDRHARQQTVRATIQWSYALLPETEQRLFARLGVFAGGWTYDAAEAVCCEGSGPDVLDGMTSLVEKSLVQAEGTGEPRFRMLETVREYAVEKLTGGEESEAIGKRHAEYFCALTEQSYREWFGPDQIVWVRRLQGDHDNIRAALAWCVDRGLLELAGRLTLGTCRFWLTCGYYREGLRWVETALGYRASLPPPLVAATLTDAAWLARRLTDYKRATEFAQEALDLFQQLGDEAGRVASLLPLALAAWNLGDTERARSLQQGSLPTLRRLGLTVGLAIALANLGLWAFHEGDYAQATAHLEESAALFRQIGDRSSRSAQLQALAMVACEQGDLERAMMLLSESLPMAYEARDKRTIAFCLEELACVLTRKGELERVPRLWSAAFALRHTTGAAHDRGELERLNRYVTLARSGMPGGEWHAAAEEGRAMTVEQAVAYALASHD